MPPSDPTRADAMAGTPEPSTTEARTIGPAELFIAFSRLALSGFGGVLPFAYRALVERLRWIEPKDFASLLAIAQVMPGPTICNLSVMIGQRFAGFSGACAALAGMVLGPACIVVALGIAWQHFGGLAAVKHALGGMSAVAIGLIFATALKMGINLFRPPREVEGGTAHYWTVRRVAQVVLCALAFIGVGLMRWPLVAVVAGLAPFAVGLAWLTDRG